MAGSLDTAIQATATVATNAFRPRNAFWFASSLTIILVMALLASLWASMQPWFVYHIDAPSAESYGYSHRAYGLNCDILIAGDSTGVTDFVSAVIEERTKLTACNVSEVRGNLDFVGTHYPIDDYLAHNRPPRFLVTGWTPGHLDLEHPPLKDTYVSAFAYGMQFHAGPWIWKAMLARPRAALTFIIWAGHSVVADTLERTTGTYPAESRVDERARRDAARGTYYIKEPAQTACLPDEELTSTYEQNVANIAAFRRHYTTPQTQVLIYVTPVADCDPLLNQLQTLSHGLGELPLQTLPVTDFTATNIHLTPEKAALYSARVADDILARMSSASPHQPANRTAQ